MARIVLLIAASLFVQCQCVSLKQSSDLSHPFNEVKSFARIWPCPSEESIVPCTCNSNDGNQDLYLDCSGAQNEAELTAALSNCVLKFPFLGFKQLTIVHSGNESLDSLSAESFCLLTFQNVRITGTKLAVIQEDVFHNSHSIMTTLQLSGNMIEEFPFETIGLYTILESINLAYNALSVLPALYSDSLTNINVNGNQDLYFDTTTFVGTQSLKEIYMDNINLRMLDADVFKIASLETLSLLGNQLERLAPGIISSSLNSLSVIAMSENNITLIEEGFITGLSEDASIEMIKNKITTIEEAVWTPIFNEMNYTGRLDLTDNPIACDCEIEWLVNSPEAMAMITATTTCNGGSPALIDLAPEAFDELCYP